MRLAGVEWEEAKNELNRQEHNGLCFEVAQYVFLDPERIERLDQSEHNASGEDRYQTLGKVGPIFFVVYTDRGENKRIISARAADKAERKSYNGYWTCSPTRFLVEQVLWFFRLKPCKTTFLMEVV
jgi:uncharacterized DUF497 family protein